MHEGKRTQIDSTMALGFAAYVIVITPGCMAVIQCRRAVFMAVY